MTTHKFKIGDKVYITSKQKSYSPHFNTTWEKGMDRYVNNNLKYTITHISYYGIYLKDSSYIWPPTALSLSPSSLPLTIEQRVLAKIKYLDQKFLERHT